MSCEGDVGGTINPRYLWVQLGQLGRTYTLGPRTCWQYHPSGHLSLNQAYFAVPIGSLSTDGSSFLDSTLTFLHYLTPQIVCSSSFAFVGFELSFEVGRYIFRLYASLDPTADLKKGMDFHSCGWTRFKLLLKHLCTIWGKHIFPSNWQIYIWQIYIWQIYICLQTIWGQYIFANIRAHFLWIKWRGIFLWC